MTLLHSLYHTVVTKRELSRKAKLIQRGGNTGLGTPRDPQSELVNVAREREVWGPLLELLPRPRISGFEKPKTLNLTMSDPIPNLNDL